MCHQFLCESCSTDSWEFCSEASDFEQCPHFSQTTYKTDKRCKSCVVIGTAIDELGFWPARHPHREASNPSSEADDLITEKSFIDSEDDEGDEQGDEAASKADSRASFVSLRMDIELSANSAKTEAVFEAHRSSLDGWGTSHKYESKEVAGRETEPHEVNKSARRLQKMKQHSTKTAERLRRDGT